MIVNDNECIDGGVDYDEIDGRVAALIESWSSYLSIYQYLQHTALQLYSIESILFYWADTSTTHPLVSPPTTQWIYIAENATTLWFYSVTWTMI